MLVFDGTYTLERKDDPGSIPTYACAWRVKVIDFASGDPSHPYIRPHAVLAVRRGGGIFKASCAESLGKRICSDFDLDVDDLLWIESFPDMPDEYYVANFSPYYRETEVTYTVTWRPILANERRAVMPWC
jgi:hypothetical protein